MKKILSLLLVMLFIFAMEVGVYAEDNDDIEFTSLAGGQNIFIEQIDGQSGLTVPETLDHTSNDNAITISYDLDQKKWENAYFDHSEDKFIFVDIYIKNLPENTEKYGICGTSYADPSSPGYASKIEDNKATIKSLRLYKVGRDKSDNPMVRHSFTIADVTHDGNNVIVIPSEKRHAFLLKLQDKDGKMTYHTIQCRVEHTSTEAFKIANAQPGEDRIVPDNGAYVKSSNYVDGTLSYLIDGNAGVQDNTIRTTLLPPGSDAARAEVQSSNNNETTLYYNDKNDVKNGVPLNHYFDASGKHQETFHIKWFNADDAVIKNEMLTIFSSNINKFWMEEKWVPAGSGDTALDAAFAEKTGLNGNFIKYYPDKGLWTFEIPEGADISALDKNKLGGNDGYLDKNKPFFIKGPAGAASVRSSSWHSPLYDSNKAGSTQLAIKPHTDTFTDESGRLCARYGFSAFLNCATLYGTDLSIFTVDRTMTGYADLIVLQWYDENDELIKIKDRDGKEKDGNYIYLEKKPYVKATTTEVKENIGSQVSEATLIIAGGSGSFKAEYPMQEQADANNSTKYLYMKLTYMDERGNEIQPGSNKATVYLPYPAGTSFESHKDVAFTLYHYKDENHTDKEEITLTPTQYGLMFETGSFSPFLLSYTLPAGSAENPDTPGSTGDSYYPSYHGPVQPVLVLPPKTGDITFFGWLRVLLGID